MKNGMIFLEAAPAGGMNSMNIFFIVAMIAVFLLFYDTSAE